MPSLNINKLTRDDVQIVINRIKREGWSQGGSQYRAGKACLIEHASAALIYTKFCLLSDRIIAEVDENPTPYRFSIIEWNDAVGRTVDEVIVLLEKIRDKCKS